MEMKVNNAIVRLHVPELTDIEREKRKKQFYTATAEFMKGAYKERQGVDEEIHMESASGSG